MTHALIERLKEPTMETPKCEKCGEEINTGMMATLCQHGSDCELWPKDMRPESELLAYRMWEAGVKQQIAMYAAELSRLRQSEAAMRLDASRYRWLRERVNYTTGETLSPCKVIYRRWFHDTTWTPAGTNNPGMFDAAIDAARAALGETKK